VIRWLILSCLSLISCGYVPVGTVHNPSHVTCVLHDSDGFDGRFIPDLQRALLEQGVLCSGSDSQSTLHITLNQNDINQIGYRYDVNPQTQGKTNRLIANEERRIVGADIWVEKEGKTVYGPIHIEAKAQYDFVDPDAINDVSFIDTTGTRVTSLAYSLGQLDAMEGARRISYDVASKKLAENIAFAVSNALEKTTPK